MTEERSRHSGVESNDQSGGLTKLERRVNSFKRLAYSGVDVWLDDLSRSLLARTFRRRLRTYRVPRSCRSELSHCSRPGRHKGSRGSHLLPSLETGSSRPRTHGG